MGHAATGIINPVRIENSILVDNSSFRTEDTRRRVFKQELISACHDEALIDGVIAKLAGARLIVTGSNNLTRRHGECPDSKPPCFRVSVGE